MATIELTDSVMLAYFASSAVVARLIKVFLRTLGYRAKDLNMQIVLNGIWTVHQFATHVHDGKQSHRQKQTRTCPSRRRSITFLRISRLDRRSRDLANARSGFQFNSRSLNFSLSLESTSSTIESRLHHLDIDEERPNFRDSSSILAKSRSIWSFCFFKISI